MSWSPLSRAPELRRPSPWLHSEAMFVQPSLPSSVPTPTAFEAQAFCTPGTVYTLPDGAEPLVCSLNKTRGSECHAMATSVPSASPSPPPPSTDMQRALAEPQYSGVQGDAGDFSKNWLCAGLSPDVDSGFCVHACNGECNWCDASCTGYSAAYGSEKNVNFMKVCSVALSTIPAGGWDSEQMEFRVLGTMPR